MYRIVYPSNWQTVGSQVDVLVLAKRWDAGHELCIIAREDFDRLGAETAPTCAPLEMRRSAGLLAVRVARPLPDGAYVFCIRDPRRQRVLAASGVHVDARLDRWARRFAAMAAAPAAPEGAIAPVAASPRFSLITTVYDTEPLFLADLADMVLAQRFGDFEWLLLDNGSTRTETIAAVQAAAARDPRIRGLRVEKNLHIIGGNRYLFERARGTYLVPVDSDDLLYPGALEAFARRCAQGDAPAVCYSDEQKVSPLGTPTELIWRPSWSSLYALATCPASHLVAFRRDAGAAAGVYSADYARGSHDWDTLLRLADAGAQPQRVEQVLYGWRMHPGSAALDRRAKRYLARSQTGVLEASLRRRGLERLFKVEYARGAMGHYHLARRRQASRPLAVDFVLRAGAAAQLDNLAHNLRHVSYRDAALRVIQVGRIEDHRADRRVLARLRARAENWIVLDDDARLGAVASEVPAGAFAKAVIDCAQRIDDPDWAWDAIGTLELDPGCGIVGGPVVVGDAIASLGYVAGLDGFVGTPLPGHGLPKVHGTTAYIRRHVTAVQSGFMVMRAEVPGRCGALAGVDADDALFGIEFCLRCREHGVSAAYTPRMRAERSEFPVHPVGSSDAALRESIRSRYRARLGEDPYYARYLSRDSARYAELDAP